MKTGNGVPLVPGLRGLADAYDGFILDLWGTLHDGLKPLPGAVDCLSQLRAGGKRVLILSNAPRRNRSVAERMHKIGIPEGLYDGILSSGEAAHMALRDGIDDWHRNLGRDCFVFGARWDGSVIEDLDIRRVGDVRAASFILAIGPARSGQTVADFEPDLAAGAARGLPMLCANPDLEVLRGPDREICAGALAARYQELGGDVRQHGKPHAPIYAMSLERLGVDDRRRVLAIGDSLRTDIAGAAAHGLDSLLISGGIHAASLGVEGLGEPDAGRLAELCAKAGVRPTVACAAFRW
ncbi:MAG: TIGR01459 family HAD-type hydrolase [Alphaproteobacteria bacterium]